MMQACPTLFFLYKIALGTKLSWWSKSNQLIYLHPNAPGILSLYLLYSGESTLLFIKKYTLILILKVWVTSLFFQEEQI